MQGLALVVRQTPAGPAVLPRRVAVTTTRGRGELSIDGPPVDDACRASLARAWDAARALAGGEARDARVHVAGAAPLAGGSAGLVVALLAVASLRGLPEAPRCFATGEVVDARGRVEGGAWTREKAEAAASLARDLGWTAPLFLSPPVAPVPDVPGIRILCVGSVREAWRALPAGPRG